MFIRIYFIMLGLFLVSGLAALLFSRLQILFDVTMICMAILTLILITKKSNLIDTWAVSLKRRARSNRREN